MDNLMTLGEVARKLGVAPHKILYLLSTLKVREPSRVAGRRVWTPDEMEEIAAIFRSGEKKENQDV